MPNPGYLMILYIACPRALLSDETQLVLELGYLMMHILYILSCSSCTQKDVRRDSDGEATSSTGLRSSCHSQVYNRHSQVYKRHSQGIQLIHRYTSTVTGRHYSHWYRVNIHRYISTFTGIHYSTFIGRQYIHRFKVEYNLTSIQYIHRQTVNSKVYSTFTDILYIHRNNSTFKSIQYSALQE